jgi:hypothetical protein
MTDPPADVVDTLREHTRRTARLLGYLEELRRHPVATAGGTDVAALVTHFSERLRTGDGQLQQLVARLEAEI